jgi:type VI protein secretion system component VasF
MTQQDQMPEAEPSFWPAQGGAGKGNTAPAAPRSRPVPPVPARASSTRLPALCQPLFQYVCRLNRSARQHRAASPVQVRTDIKSILAEARSRAASGGSVPGGPAMSEQWKRVEPVLLFFVDFMIRSSTLPYAMKWDDLAREFNGEMAGDEKFFDLLDVALADRSEAGADRVQVFYTCLGLGFTGFNTGQPEMLRRLMLDCSTHIRNNIDADGSGKICPDAYENVNTADLIESPGKSVIGVVIALAGMVIVLFVANWLWFHNSVEKLHKEVHDLSGQIQPDSAAGTAGQSAAVPDKSAAPATPAETRPPSGISPGPGH